MQGYLVVVGVEQQLEKPLKERATGKRGWHPNKLLQSAIQQISIQALFNLLYYLCILHTANYILSFLPTRAELHDLGMAVVVKDSVRPGPKFWSKQTVILVLDGTEDRTEYIVKTTAKTWFVL